MIRFQIASSAKFVGHAEGFRLGHWQPITLSAFRQSEHKTQSLQMFKWLFNDCGRKRAQLEKFNFIMGFARDLAQKNPVALIDLVRLLLRPLQFELLLSAVETEIHKARHEVESYHGLGIQHGHNHPQLDSNQFLVNLNRDPILPCPWHRDRYVGTVSSIGKNKPCGLWKEDTSNHHVTLWLPWGIAFVDGGNHSIAAGILGGEGTLKPKQVYDMKRLLDTVHCDGEVYRSTLDGQVIADVCSYNIAALFEIGRLLQEHNIVPMRCAQL
jgi:hypothetical protein